MKTIIRTTIKGNETISVKESVDEIYESLTDKTSFMRITIVEHSGNEKKAILKKSSIKMVKS